jgi:hypothetical protein
MYNCPFFQDSQGLFAYHRQDLFSYIRFLHASPGAPNVDIYINDRLVAKDLAYKQFTPYLKLTTGLYDIRVFKTGTTNSPVATTQFQVPNNAIFTMAVTGLPNSINIQPILDPMHQLKPGTSLIRFVHLSPNAPAVDVSLIRGKDLFKDVSYKEVTDYLTISPGMHGFQIKQAGTENVVLTIPNIRILPNKILSIYAVGLLNGTPPLQVLIPLDGSTYLKF